ncbi:beta-ketoacyl-ACP synthase III [Candidatus Methylacidithermus pantelleriae]|uniref:Beta-ketoacyl-[acyl-carrier-protein] synthase III n=1 Tax=Candidatus Methylacidithermus pantelleriae TaxID=2744239 RepID=A0A8J2FTW1_9BACT|nr:beta-ketoacyl-ACP synthase III [Candidatus Methylacidithermus pantelleriae]CAF0704962.1 beta-ketoacyl-(acyl carrier protein) synthase III [Candidatus Methylacidithermus pantelleriae]
MNKDMDLGSMCSPLPRSASVISTGLYLPTRVLSNHELEKMVDTTDEWIRSRTGIRERRIASDKETPSFMGARAAEMALREAQLLPTDIDLLLVATTTPDTVFPSTACHIQRELGARHIPAFDIQAACSGFLYAMFLAGQCIATGAYETILVVGTEKLSTILDWEDRNTCVLFGDGAGAVIMRHCKGKRGILSFELGADGSLGDLLTVPGGGARLPLRPDNIHQKLHYIRMDGRKVFRQAIEAMDRCAKLCLKKAGIRPSDLSCIFPHQANIRIIEALAQRLELPLDAFHVHVERYGNTSAACIPIALHEASHSGRIRSGDLLLLVAFGAGLTWAGIVLEW